MELTYTGISLLYGETLPGFSCFQTVHQSRSRKICLRFLLSYIWLVGGKPDGMVFRVY